MSREVAGGLLWRRQLRLPLREHVGVVVALIVTLLALFREFVFEGRVVYERDVHLYWYAQVQAFFSAVVSGAAPLWDPSASFGEPLWAYPTQIPYPTTSLNLLMPPWYAYTAIVLLHLVFSGLGLYALALRLGVSRTGAAFGALAWICSGPLLSVVNVMNNVTGAAWIPWIVLAGRVALDTGRALHAWVWGAAVAAPVLAGSEAVFMGGLLTAADGLRRLSWRRPLAPGNRMLVRTGVLACTFALALAAAQWLPTLELTSRTTRGAFPREARTAWSLDVLSLAQTALPFWTKELPLRSESLQGAFEPQAFLGSVYLGIPLLALAAAAFGSRRRHARFFALGALLSLGFALGRNGPVYDLAVLLLPPLGALRFPVKAVILTAFCVSVLAAMGVDSWRDADARGRRWSWQVAIPATVLAVAAALGAGALFWFAEPIGRRFLVGGAASPSFQEILAPTLQRLAAAAVVGGLVAALAWRRARGRHDVFLRFSAVAVLSVADLVASHWTLNPSAPVELYQYRPPTLAAVQPLESARLYYHEAARPEVTDWTLKRPREGGAATPVAVALTLREYLLPPVAAVFGIHGSYESDVKKIQPAGLRALTEHLQGALGDPAHLRLLQLGAVTHVVSLDPRGFERLTRVGVQDSLFGDPIHVFRVPGTLPRAYVVGRVREATGREAIDALIDPGFDPRREVVVASAPASLRAGADASGRARVLKARADRVELEAELSADGLLVVVEAFDPWWRAWVDGRPAPLLRANVAFRAVPVPAGRHKVVLRYRPVPVLVGLVLSGLGLVAGALLVGLAMRRRPGIT